MFISHLNEPIKAGHLQKLANQSRLNGALVIEMVSNSFSERKKAFGLLIKRETFKSKKIKIWTMKNIFPLHFSAIFLKRDSSIGIFPVKFTKFLRAPNLKNICKPLLLYLQVILFITYEKDTANET